MAAQTIELPLGLVRRLLDTAKELRGYVPASPPEETVLVPGQGEWSQDMVEELARAVQPYKGAVTLLTLAANKADQIVRYPEVVKKSGLPEMQVRSDLGAMSKASRRLFGRRQWPLRPWQASDGIMSYQMPAKTAAWWLATKQ